MMGEKSFRVGIVGAGAIGKQMFRYLILSGFQTVLKTRDENKKKVLEEETTQWINAKGQKELSAKWHITTDYSRLGECDIIIETVVENIAAKSRIIQTIDEVCSAKTILCTNTSSLSVEMLSGFSSNPDRFIGLHFFNPVYKMNLVEMIPTLLTSSSTISSVSDFVEQLGKRIIVVQDTPGFIVNRLLIPQINDAIKMIESGIARKEDIDASIKLGLNHPMGPIELADFIGLDVCRLILESLYEQYGDDRFVPSTILVEMVEKNQLGRKTGHGFYSY